MKKGARLRIPGGSNISKVIHSIRGEKVILDADLAKIYGVETASLNRAVKRNIQRFPKDFIFQLTPSELGTLKCQIGISNSRRGGRRYLPYAFTEHGAIMTANLLNSAKAVQMSVFVVRAFLKMREALSETANLASKLARLEREIKGRLDSHEKAIVDVLQQLMQILNPTESEPVDVEPRRQIGFHAKPQNAIRDSSSRRK
jgi:phage regulator Rha-like protein